MRILYFCAGCSLLLDDPEQDICFNCNTPLSEKIPGEFKDEDAEKLETAASDQTA